MSNSTPTTRRRFLRAVGGIGAVGVAGPVGSANSLQGGAIPMGSLLPVTGELSDFGSGMQAAVNIAVEHVNAAGGPLDREIAMTNRDSETRPSAGLQKYTALVNEQNIVGFVGAASSGVSTAIAEQVAQDQVMQVSNASTSPALAEIGYNQDRTVKYFGRTSPNDGQQGIVMGRILSDDEYIGADTAAFLFVDNPYGAGLAELASQSFEGETVDSVPYSQQTADYTATLDRLFQNDPEAVGFVGYPGNGRTILSQWSDGGYGGEWVLSEGLNSASFLQELSDIVAGMYISSPNPEETRGASTFEEAIGEQDTLFAPHAYDALFLQALAMHRAGEASGTAIARNIRAVSIPGVPGETEGTETPGPETETEGAETPDGGTETPGGEAEGNVVTVDEFQRAKELLDQGESVNYQGASSPVDLNENLEPLNAFAILQVQDDGSTEILQTIPRSFFEGRL